MAAGAIRCVDVKRDPKTPPLVAIVNVAEDVQAGAGALRCGTKLLATDIPTRLGPVEHEMGRAVGNQDIDVRRNQVPLLAELRATLEVEGHVKEPWLPGRTPKGHAPNLDAAVQEIVTTGKDLRTQVWVRLQTSVVVSGDHHLVPVRKAAEELPERSRFGSLALAAEVARTDQHVTIGDADLPVQAVCITEKDQTHEWPIGSASRRFSLHRTNDARDNCEPTRWRRQLLVTALTQVRELGMNLF